MERVMGDMATPWGTSQVRYRLDRGVWLVSTAGHGGVMVGKGWAMRNLTEGARAHGLLYGSYLCFEEDIDAELLVYEYPDLFVGTYEDTKDRTLKQIRENAWRTLSTWRADYLIGRGIEPETEGYDRFLRMREEREMRERKDPDLILSAVGSWHTGISEVVEVTTADGHKYRVTEESYRGRNKRRHNLLSGCTLVV